MTRLDSIATRFLDASCNWVPLVGLAVVAVLVVVTVVAQIVMALT